jgi:hypothetical protein
MAERRGSEEWLKESFERAVVRLERSDLELFIDLARLDGVDLIDWTTRGIPNPDVLHGAFQVKPEAARDVFERLSGLDRWIWHDWFPIGIPDPDQYLVSFSNRRELGR